MSLDALIAARAGGPVRDSVTFLTQLMRDKFGESVQAVLFYGSCLRRSPDAADADEGLFDLYVLVDSYRHCYRRRRCLGWANALLPPNVFYAEMPGPRGMLRAKYAVMSLDQFCRLVTPESFNASLWARFAQPSQIAFARNAAVEARLLQALAQSVRTYLAATLPLLPAGADSRAAWLNAFRQSYRAELRPEDTSRALTLYEADRDYYDAALTAFHGENPPLISAGAARRQWALRRLHGKMLNVLRLIKAAFTFDGGADYILWKVARHSGVTIDISDWQRRHPILAAPILAWRLYRKGAFR